jgi:hypothetical protein
VGSSSNASTHCKNYHAQLFTTLDPDYDGEEDPQRKLTQYATYKGRKMEECHRAVTAFCLRGGGHAFELVRGEPFKHLIATLSDNKYQGIATETLRRHIDEMEEQLRDITNKKLSNAVPGTMTLILDGWSSE